MIASGGDAVEFAADAARKAAEAHGGSTAAMEEVEKKTKTGSYWARSVALSAAYASTHAGGSQEEAIAMATEAPYRPVYGSVYGPVLDLIL